MPSRIWRRWRPRSVRARLVATYTLVALVLAAGGFALFAMLLDRGITASMDATLQTRIAPLVNSVASSPEGAPLETGLAPASLATDPGALARGTTGGQQAAAGIDSFSLVYDPAGTIVQIEPTSLRGSPLSPDELVRADRGPVFFTIGNEEAKLRVLASPVVRTNGTWVVAVGANADVVSDAANRAIRDLLLTVPLLIIVAAIGTWLLSGAALRPVERLRLDAARLGANDPKSRLRVPDTGDELARLADTFNGLLERLQSSVGRQRDLVADAGHELRTPLAILRTELDLADRPRRTREDLADSIVHARREVDRLCRLAEDLLFLARADQQSTLIEPVPGDLAEIVTETCRAARALADQTSVSMIADAPQSVPVLADRSAMRRAIDNLVSNALRATPPGGTVTVAAAASGDTAVISVSDTGPGFPEDFLPVAFERFRRPDNARGSDTGGSGLGLAIVAEIVRAHHGTVRAYNRPEGGGVVTLTIPLRSAAIPAGTADPPAARRAVAGRP